MVVYKPLGQESSTLHNCKGTGGNDSNAI